VIELTQTRDETGPDQVQVIKLTIPDSDYMAMNENQLDALQHTLEDLRDLVRWINA